MDTIHCFKGGGAAMFVFPSSFSLQVLCDHEVHLARDVRKPPGQHQMGKDPAGGAAAMSLILGLHLHLVLLINPKGLNL